MTGDNHLFVSHSSKNVDRANELVLALEAAGHGCWLSHREIRIGDNYASAIVEAIRGAKGLIALLSEKALTSHNVQREVGLSLHAEIPLLPVVLDPSVVSSINDMPQWQYWLHTSQFIPWTERQSVVDQVTSVVGGHGHSPRGMPMPPDNSSLDVVFRQGVDAVEQARELGDVERALQLSEAALTASAGAEPKGRRLLAHLHRHADLLNSVGRHEEALTVFEHVLSRLAHGDEPGAGDSAD